MTKIVATLHQAITHAPYTAISKLALSTWYSPWFHLCQQATGAYHPESECTKMASTTLHTQNDPCREQEESTRQCLYRQTISPCCSTHLPV